MTSKQGDAAAVSGAQVAFYTGLILCGCFLNNVVLELIVRHDSGAGPLLTLFQFCFVALQGVRGNVHLSLSFPFVAFKPRAPFREYLKMTALFFLISVANNKAFDWGISQPFNVVFRSSSLLISFLIGALAFNNKYSKLHFLAVSVVTMGVLLTTSAEVVSKSQPLANEAGCCDNQPIWSKAWEALWSDSSAATHDPSAIVQWTIGTTLLGSTIIGLAVLGHMQGVTYKKFGSTSAENIFYTHLIPIPMFLVLKQDLQKHIAIWNNSTAWDFSTIGITTPIPSLWILCLLNVITQWICVEGVHRLTAARGTLTATFATTVRKFVSLLFSIVYFQHAFTSMHWAGSILVFGGSFLYIQADARSRATVSKKEQ